jgi:hypothetical protein
VVCNASIDKPLIGGESIRNACGIGTDSAEPKCSETNLLTCHLIGAILGLQQGLSREENII